MACRLNDVTLHGLVWFLFQIGLSPYLSYSLSNKNDRKKKRGSPSCFTHPSLENQREIWKITRFEYGVRMKSDRNWKTVTSKNSNNLMDSYIKRQQNNTSHFIFTVIKVMSFIKSKKMCTFDNFLFTHTQYIRYSYILCKYMYSIHISSANDPFFLR